MPSIQDFRNMVGQYSEGYLSMTTDSSGNQQLSKVANHHTFTFLNPSEAKVRERLGGVAAQNVRQALAEALRGESETILEHPAVRKVLFGDANAAGNAVFSSKPLSRREVRQVFEVLDLQKLFAKSGVRISKDDLPMVKNELFRVKDNCTSAYVKALSLLLPSPPKPGKAPLGVLTSQVCALIAEKADVLHKAFLGKTDDQITGDLLWKTLFCETMPENALEDEYGDEISFGQAVDNRFRKMFNDQADSKLDADRRDSRVNFAYQLFVSMGLTLSGGLKFVNHPEKITRSDIAPGANALPNGVYSRDETVLRLMGDIPRAKSLTFGVLYHRAGRPDNVQQFKLAGNVNKDECTGFCESLNVEIQRAYSEKLMQKGRMATVIPQAQMDSILSFCHQSGDNLLSYPGANGISDKNILVKANGDGTIDLLVSCRTCGNEGRPGSAALCRIHANGKAEILDFALAQDHAQITRKFVFNGAI